MIWFWISVGLLGGFFFLTGKARRTLKQIDVKKARPAEKAPTPQDRVEAVAASGDVEQMTSVLKETDNPLLRNALLGQIVARYYRDRSEPETRSAFYRYAGQHIEELPAVVEMLDKSEKGRPDRVETFKMMAIALGEDKRYDEAIAVCRTALSLGLENGTRTGFEGRIARLEKKRDPES